MKPEMPGKVVAHCKGLYEVVYNKYFVDEIYFANIINPLVNASRSLWAYVDVNFIDRTTYVVSDIVRGAGSMARSIQTGNLQQYALYIALAVATVIAFLLEKLDQNLVREFLKSLG
jgi:NADH-quinone oxidoreductase subunit L